MPLTLTPVTATAALVCSETLACSDSLPCRETGATGTPISTGSLSMTVVSAGSLTLTPVVPV
jgi:hypothetical protein